MIPGLALLKSPKILAFIAGGVLLTLVGIKAASFINAKYEAERENDRLQTEVSALEERLETQKFLTEQAEEARIFADKARARAEVEATRYRQIRDDIVQPGDENEEVPTSLRRTLDALRSVGVHERAAENTD